MNITKEDMEALRNAQPSWFKNGGLAANVDLTKPSFLSREQPHRTLTKRAEMELGDKEQNFQQRSHPMQHLLCPTSATLTIVLTDITPCPSVDMFDLNGTYTLTLDSGAWSVDDVGSFHYTDDRGSSVFHVVVTCDNGILTIHIADTDGDDNLFFLATGRLGSTIANTLTPCGDPVYATGGTAVVTLP